MSMVKLELIDGQRGEKTASGWKLTRTAMVYGLTGTASARLVAAVTAVEAEGIEIGDAHPAQSDCVLISMTPEARASDVVHVTMTYSSDPADRSEANPDDPDYAEIEVGSRCTQQETNKDVEGSTVTVGYTFPADYPIAEYTGRAVKASPKIPFLKPETTIVYTRKEKSDPTNKALNYVGRCNTGGWSRHPEATERQWLCTGIVGRSSDGGATYRVTYEFQYRGANWDPTVMYIDPNTGAPPNDLVYGTGEKIVQIYEMIDFNGLNL